VKIDGEMPYLWRAIDQEGETMKSQDCNRFAGQRKDDWKVPAYHSDFLKA